MRARVMGFMGMMGALAMSAGAAIAGRLVGTPALMMTVPVLLALATTFPLILLYKDPQRDKDDVPALVRQLTGATNGQEPAGGAPEPTQPA